MRRQPGHLHSFKQFCWFFLIFNWVKDGNAHMEASSSCISRAVAESTFIPNQWTEFLGLVPNNDGLYSFISVVPVPMLWFEPPDPVLEATMGLFQSFGLLGSCTALGVHEWRGYTPIPPGLDPSHQMLQTYGSNLTQAQVHCRTLSLV